MPPPRPASALTAAAGLLGHAHDLAELRDAGVFERLPGDQRLLVRTCMSMDGYQDFRRRREHPSRGGCRGHLPRMRREKCVINLIERVTHLLREPHILTVR